MPHRKDASAHRRRESQPIKEKKNNPFSEQEKHGEKAQYEDPEIQQEYQGGQPDKRRAPGVDGDLRKRTETQDDSRRRVTGGSDAR